MSRKQSPELAAPYASGIQQTTWNVVPSAASLTIEVTRAPEAARIAPEGVWFEARAEGFDVPPKPAPAEAYIPEFHEIEYVWDFGEPSDLFEAPQNLPDAYRDANKAIGQIAAHVFRTGGTKRVRCTARRLIDPDTMEIEEAVAVVEFDVGSPETFWTEFNTVVVALDGDFSDAPPGSRATVVSHSESEPWWSLPEHWMTQANRLIGEGERSIRILFKRGAAYPMWLFRPNLRAPHIAQFMLFGAWGDENKYRPTFPRIGFNKPGWSNNIPIVFQSVRASHDYDPVTEKGSEANLMLHQKGGYTLMTNVGFQRAGTGVVMETQVFALDAPPGHTYFHDCSFEALASYGVYAYERHDDRVAYLGCRDIDVGSAPHGGDMDRSKGNTQGPMRVAGLGDWVISGSDFFSRYGWTRQNTWPGTDVDATAEQACIRVFSAGNVDQLGNGRVVISRCAAEAGQFLSGGALNEDFAPKGNLLIDQIVCIQSPSGMNLMGIESGGLTVRNSLWIKPNVPGSFGISAAFLIGPRTREPEFTMNREAHLAEPIRIYNNTFVVLQPSEIKWGVFASMDEFTNYEEANNVFYMPNNVDHPRHEDIAPFEKERLWDLRWLGRLEYADNGILQTQFAPPKDTASLYRPTIASPLVGSVAGEMSLYDLLDNPRDEFPTRGALQPKSD